MVAGVSVGETVGSAIGGMGDLFGQVIVITGKIIPGLLIGGAVFGIGVLILQELVFYKHKVRLKKVVGNGLRWFEDRAREKKLKNGAKVWYLKKLRKNIPIPPDEVQMLDTRGKLVVEGYLTGDNHIFWGKDNISVEKIRKKVSDIKEELEQNPDLLLTEEQKQLLVFNANFQPVSTNERIVIGQEMEEAKFGKTSFNELLHKALPYAFMLTLLILFLFGFKYYAGPLNDYGKELLGTIAPIAENNRIAAELQYQMNQNVQIMREDITFLKNEIQKGNGTG